MDNQENVTRDNEGADKKLLEDEVGRLFFFLKKFKTNGQNTLCRK